MPAVQGHLPGVSNRIRPAAVGQESDGGGGGVSASTRLTCSAG